MELTFPFFKVMNSMKFRAGVWILGSFVEIFLGSAKLLYASIFFMKFDEKQNFAEIDRNLILKLKVFPKTTEYNSFIFIYTDLVTMFNALCLQYAYQMHILVWNFTFFVIKNSMEKYGI